jgi:hypothetical protein
VTNGSEEIVDKILVALNTCGIYGIIAAAERNHAEKQ